MHTAALAVLRNALVCQRCLITDPGWREIRSALGALLRRGGYGAARCVYVEETELAAAKVGKSHSTRQTAAVASERGTST